MAWRCSKRQFCNGNAVKQDGRVIHPCEKFEWGRQNFKVSGCGRDSCACKMTGDNGVEVAASEFYEQDAFAISIGVLNVSIHGAAVRQLNGIYGANAAIFAGIELTQLLFKGIFADGRVILDGFGECGVGEEENVQKNQKNISHNGLPSEGFIQQNGNHSLAVF